MAQAPNLTSLSLSMDVDQIGYHQLVSERLAKARILAEPVLTNLVELELERQDVCKRTMVDFVRERSTTLRKVTLKQIRDGEAERPDCEAELLGLLQSGRESGSEPSAEVSLVDSYNGNAWLLDEWV